jgi:hypothetical protein
MIGISSLVYSITYNGKASTEYHLVQLGEMRRDQFLIDKKSGRIWENICLGEVDGSDCKGLGIWEEMYVRGVTPSTTRAFRLHEYFAKSTKDKVKKTIKDETSSKDTGFKK